MYREQSPERTTRFTQRMQKKLLVLFIIVLIAFILLSIKLIFINRDSGIDYKKQVLSQQEYDSTTIPFKRGEIVDRNGTVLAVSNKVYNVILDSKILLTDEAYLEPTLNALLTVFRINVSDVRAYINEHPTSSYYVLKKQVPYTDMAKFLELQNDPENGVNIKGVWFEDEYKREYPNGALACDVIGFTRSDNSGMYGLEEYYNDVLCGTNGREYGYLNDDSNLQRTTISAIDGYNIESTIDANIQSIVEKYLRDFNDTYKDNAHVGNGAENLGCIIMEVNTGNILAMANYPVFDLNDTRNSENILGMNELDEKGNKTGDYVTQEKIDAMNDEQMYLQLNALWKNFCISDTYEPGSVSKPFTVAAALEDGAITGNEGYNCPGYLTVGDYDIYCHNRNGDGYLTVAEGIERSCNVVMMKISFALGTTRFVDYQHLFGFGLKTNIDLAGESRTVSMVYDKSNMGVTEMATCSFGQGYNSTMIQMITGFCSLINGGKYYEPHMVSKITSGDGSVVELIEPRVLKQTISQSTSDTIVDYCNLVVAGEHGTGKTARPAGYMIGGKTGTAETLPRGNNQYVLSFMGYAPVDNPQIAIYVVVDRPNVWYQDDAKFATRIVRKILTEVLPYLNIYMTEELSDSERQELEELQIQITTQYDADTSDDADAETEGDVSNESDNGEEEPTYEGEAPAEQENEEIWKTFEIDPATGYAIDPVTGYLVDPETGAAINAGSVLPDTSEDNGDAEPTNEVEE